MYYVYALKSTVKNYVYIGLTNNLKRRITEHNKGKEKTTRKFAPFVLIYFEVVNNRIEARKREKYMKTTNGREYLKELPSQMPSVPAQRKSEK